MSLSRRDFLKLGGAAVFGVAAAEMGDLFLFNGYVTSNLLRAKRDPEFRERLLSTIRSGRIDDKLRQEWEEQTRPYEPNCHLAEAKGSREDILDKGFAAYEVRPLVVGKEQTNNLLLVANLKSNMTVFRTAQTKNDAYNLTETMQEKGSSFVMPSPLLKLRDGHYEIGLYSSYVDGGQVINYGRDQVEFSSGALVVNPDHSAQVIDRGDVLRYKVGRNCLALQSYAVAVNSDTFEQDMKSLGRLYYNGADFAEKARVNSCFLVSLYDKEDVHRQETLALSVYQHLDSHTLQADGDEWALGMSMEQGAHICQQLALERKYDKFVMVAPDPNHIHSHMNGPIVREGQNAAESWLRQFTFRDAPLFQEKEGVGYEVPIFIGAKLS